MPGNQTLVRKIARTLLAQHGMRVVWKLHQDAATLHRIGNAIGAAAILEIAEAAEMECLPNSVSVGDCWRETPSGG